MYSTGMRGEEEGGLHDDVMHDVVDRRRGSGHRAERDQIEQCVEQPNICMSLEQPI